MNRNEAIELLEKYTIFLQKNGYIDTDAACEDPYAIDEFLKEKLIDLDVDCIRPDSEAIPTA